MRVPRSLVFMVTALLIAVSSFAQDRASWRTAADIQEGVRGLLVGTVADVDEARNQIVVEADDDTGPRITVLGDSVSTQYNGFGGVINGQPEIFTGTQGLANVRVGDRVEVRGIGAGNASVRADVITLRGRPVPASQTGVGTTRSPSSISTPTSTSTSSADRVGPVEGVVQEVNASEGRIVIVTDRREVMTVRTTAGTPVSYKGETYRVANLEIGDRIRVQPSGTGGVGGELRAASISVTRSAQEGAAVPNTNSLSGRVASIDRSADMIRVDTGRTSVRVDVATATDTMGRRVRAIDFKAGDQIQLTGRYSPTAADLFIASSVRFPEDLNAGTDNGVAAGTSADAYPPAAGTGELGAVTIYGTVREALATSPQLVVRDSAGRTVRINVLEDFLVRGRKGTYETAEALKAGDSVVVKAYRDNEGNYIAQTIRVR